MRRRARARAQRPDRDAGQDFDQWSGGFDQQFDQWSGGFDQQVDQWSGGFGQQFWPAATSGPGIGTSRWVSQRLTSVRLTGVRLTSMDIAAACVGGPPGPFAGPPNIGPVRPRTGPRVKRRSNGRCGADSCQALVGHRAGCLTTGPGCLTAGPCYFDRWAHRAGFFALLDRGAGLFDHRAGCWTAGPVFLTTGPGCVDRWAGLFHHLDPCLSHV
jgi:hypothetical protein